MVRKVDDDLYLAEGDEEFEDYNESDPSEEKKTKNPKKSADAGEDVEEEAYREDELEEEKY